MQPTYRSRCAALLILTLLALPFPGPPARAARADLVTEFERSGGKRTADYAQTLAYLDRLRGASPWVRVSTFGTTPEGRPMKVVVVDRHGHFTPTSAHSGDNAVVLVQAGIHAGEIDGKDAGLMLIRDMAVDKKLAALLDHVTLVFIPVYNVDGHERTSAYNRGNQNGPEIQGFRATAVNLNLNRDYMKADAVETRAWLALWNEWTPDFFIDCHVTDGADYQYVVTYVAEVWPTQDSAVAAWTSERYVPPLERQMKEAGLPLAPYCNFRRYNDPKSGIKSGPSTPRFSTGYAALRNRPAVLIETHMLKDYATRVHGTYEMLNHSLAVIGAERVSLRAAIRDADARAAALEKQTVPLDFTVDNTDSVMMDFLGIDYTEQTSDITGGAWVRFGKTPTAMRIPYFAKNNATAEATVPAGYVIPVAWTSVIERVKAHGIKTATLSKAVTMDVATYHFSKVKWAADSFEAHHSLTYDMTPITEKVTFPAGSVVVDTAQPTGKVIVGLLEPAAPDALVRWGFLDASFEQKEYLEAYMMEQLIRKMLAEDPSLAKDFATAKADSEFTKDPESVRRWFYERSPYYEKSAGLYPIGRILDRGVLEKLPVTRQGRS